jgi:hypothetical protein
MVTDQVWEQAGMTDTRQWLSEHPGTPTGPTGGPGHYLCIGCLENRLGRRLTPADFPGTPINRIDWHRKTTRLAARLTGTEPGPSARPAVARLAWSGSWDLVARRLPSTEESGAEPGPEGTPGHRQNGGAADPKSGHVWLSASADPFSEGYPAASSSPASPPSQPPAAPCPRQQAAGRTRRMDRRAAAGRPLHDVPPRQA